MARYKAKQRTFVNDTLIEEGHEFISDKEPGEAWEPVDDGAHAAVAAAEQRRSAKAQAIAAGVATAGNEELVGLVKDLIDKSAALGARVTELEARSIPDVADFARGVDLAPLSAALSKLGEDIAELDAGLQIIDGRLSEVEGVQKALASGSKRPPPPTEPEPAPPPSEEPLPEAEADGPLAEEPPQG